MNERKEEIITRTSFHKKKGRIKKKRKVHNIDFSDKRKVGIIDFWE